MSFLKQSPPIFVKELLQYMKPFCVNVGDYIARDADMGTCLFILESGRAKR